MEEQQRVLWDHAAIGAATGLLTEALRTTVVGPYQVQAAIAAVHAEAGRAQDTDWPQILALYDLLLHLSPGPMTALSRAVAVAMVHGPRLALAEVAGLEGPLAGHHRLYAVRAHLHELAGDPVAARDDYLLAAGRALNERERRYLESRAAFVA